MNGAKSYLEMTGDIVAAMAGNQVMSPEDMSAAIRRIYGMLVELGQFGVEGHDNGQVTISAPDSIQRNQIICLVCGKAFKLLSNRHLALHGMTPREYKQKYGIRMTQALSAKTLSARRRKLAKELGMGKQLAEWRAQRKQGATG